MLHMNLCHEIHTRENKLKGLSNAQMRTNVLFIEVCLNSNQLLFKTAFKTFHKDT